MLPEKVGFISYIYNFITHFPTSPNFFVGEKILWVRGSTLLPPALIHSPVKVLVEWLTYIFHTRGLMLNTFFLSLINVFNCSKVIVLQVFLSRSDKKKKKIFIMWSKLWIKSFVFLFGSSLLSRHRYVSNKVFHAPVIMCTVFPAPTPSFSPLMWTSSLEG